MTVAQQGMGSAIDEFQSYVKTGLYQQVVIAHPKTVHRTEAARAKAIRAGVPQQRSRFGTRIRRRDCRKREDTMAVISSARGDRRN
jgi:RNase H-fold protein (predicted Holliday junction resolvase)